jgi:hypothetical protein
MEDRKSMKDEEGMAIRSYRNTCPSLAILDIGAEKNTKIQCLEVNAIGRMSASYSGPHANTISEDLGKTKSQ